MAKPTNFMDKSSIFEVGAINKKRSINSTTWPTFIAFSDLVKSKTKPRLFFTPGLSRVANGVSHSIPSRLGSYVIALYL
jgi:hypothetical protein